MSRYQVSYRASDKHAVLQKYGASAVAGHTVIGDFYHNGGGTDAVGARAASHVLYHDIQDLLYREEGEQNMQAVNIVIKRVTAIDAAAADVAMSVASDATEQITCTFTPADASIQDLTYESSDPTKATVSATGLITAVAAGTAVITVRAVDGGASDTITVTVSA